MSLRRRCEWLPKFRCDACEVWVVHSLEVEPEVGGGSQGAADTGRGVDCNRSAAFDDRVDADRRYAYRLG